MGYINGSNDNSELVKERTGYTMLNTQGLEKTCIEYKNSTNVTVEFKEPHYITNNCWANFSKGKIRNPYLPTVHGVGIRGTKYNIRGEDGKNIKEYQCWNDLLFRVYANKSNDSTSLRYKSCIVCEEWLMFENFYEWLHEQENFNKWFDGERWCLDKDIIYKGNKLYAPDRCLLVPNNVNTLFVKRDIVRGELPIGVHKNHNRFAALCSNSVTGKNEYYGTYDTPEEAFAAYKIGKENTIKQIAKIEFDAGNITKKCYNAMLKYKVEITD